MSEGYHHLTFVRVQKKKNIRYKRTSGEPTGDGLKKERKLWATCKRSPQSKTILQKDSPPKGFVNLDTQLISIIKSSQTNNEKK